MRSEAPLVSVFCPTYQHEAYIAEAIEAILAQDYPNVELVIGDDASTDNTWSIISEYQRRYPAIVKAVRNAHNLGVTANCNAIFARCTGKYVGFYAGDDVWMPGKIRRQVELLEAQPSCAFVYHDVEVFDDDSQTPLYNWNSGTDRPKAVDGDAQYVLGHLVRTGAGFMSALSAMIRRPFLGDGPWYDPRVPHLSELTMWVKILSTPGATVRFIPEVLARYRKHGAGLTSRNLDAEMDIFLAIIENERIDLLKQVRQARSYRYYARGVSTLAAGNSSGARDLLFMSLRNGIYSPKLFYWLAKTFGKGLSKRGSA